jgi:hypothetical protein
MSDKVTITCPVHGDYTQSPNDHLKGSGCARCNYSKGERFLAGILTKHDIKFIPQFKLPLHQFRYDFYLPDHNVLIEFHGIQHYLPVKHFGGKKTLKQTQFRDKLKKALAREHRIPIHVVNYKHLETIPPELLEEKIIKLLKLG